MADKDISFLWDIDKTLRLFPDRRYGLSLSTWGANAKTADEEAAPNKGSYESTVDDTYRYYVLFEGSAQPDDWSEWLAVIDILLNATPQTSSPVVLPPPENPALSTGYGYTYNNQMVATAGIEVLFQMIVGPDGEEQLIQTIPFTVESDEAGLITVDLLRGATYKVWGTDVKRGRVIEVPNEDSFALPEILLW